LPLWMKNTASAYVALREDGFIRFVFLSAFSTLKKIMLFVALISLTSLGWAQSNREIRPSVWIMQPRCCTRSWRRRTRAFRKKFWNTRKCIAVVPHMLKGGFVFGAENGRGVATCRTANGWSAPAFFAITGGSWGLQIGVEGIDLVMIIQNDKGMQRLLESKFQLGADASAAAGPVGRHASADTDWKLNTEILTYSRAKGAFAGLTLNGASIRRDDDSMEAIYGRHVTTRGCIDGKVAAPEASEHFLNAVRGAKAQAVAGKVVGLRKCAVCTGRQNRVPGAPPSRKGFQCCGQFSWSFDLWLLGFSLHIAGGLIHLCWLWRGRSDLQSAERTPREQ
jgi:lipid-binding SYLF domain-containing protein